MKNLLGVATLALTLGLLACPSVRAQGRGPAAGHAAAGHAPTHIDGRFGPGYSYYDHGYEPRGSPQGGYTVHHGGASLSYDRDHWYRRDHGRTIIIGASFGAFVPLLPWHYSSLWWDGLPYYYVNDTYYIWDADQDQYQVVEPPAVIESEAKLAPAIGDLARCSQAGDPEAAVKVIIKAVSSKNPPLHLPLGKESIERIRKKLKALEDEISEWQSLSSATDFATSGFEL